MEYHPTHFERDTADEPVAHDARGRVAPEPDQSTVATPEYAAGSDDCGRLIRKSVGDGRTGPPARRERGGAGRGRGNGCGSGGGFEGDLVAEGFELADVVALLAVGVDAAVVEVGAEVVEAGFGVGQQVPDDDQDGAADGDDGLLLAAAAGDAPVAFAEEGVGPGRRPTAASPRTRAR